MSVLKNFKNTPRSPPIGRQALSVIFFLQIYNKVPGKKKRPFAPLGRPLGPTRKRGRGPVAPPSGDRGTLPYISIRPPIPSHLSPKIPQKSRKKERGEEKGSGEALPDSALVICRLVHLVYVFFPFKYYSFK